MKSEAPTVNWPVFAISGVIIIAVAAWAGFLPESAGGVLATAVTWISINLGWFYIALATVVTLFVIIIAVSGWGTIRLGPDHSRPEFSLYSWTAMLFAAGIGVDLLFFGVAEPIYQYYGPPEGSPETVQAARDAIVLTLFHYGISGWALYSLMGMCLAYFAYRHGLPLTVRSALYPIIGKRIYGPAGHAVDIAAVLGTVFGVATSLGIGVVQLNYGLTVLFGIPENRAAQLALIALAVGVATISAVSGVDKGIKRLSEINVGLALGLLAYVLITGKFSNILNGLVMNVGDYASSFMGLTLNTYAYAGGEATEWLSAWTLFFWAWWIAWAPFVGLFLARISKGRTLRQFIIGTLTLPFLFVLLWITVFGNAAIMRVIGGDKAFGELTMASPQTGFYELLKGYPGAPVVIVVASLIGLLLYITSADSAALVMANLSSKISSPDGDGPPWARIFWAVATGALTMAMLIVGGINALQNATLIIGLPFAIVVILVM
ncbi:MAG: high-affinity choline transporter BetT, partial [Actinomycetales bacterium]